MPFPNKETQWKPGQSGNPKGHSRSRRLTDALLKLIDEGGLDERLMEVGLKAALRGDFKFWAAIYERIEGRVTDKPDMGPDGSEEEEEIPIPPRDPRYAARRNRRKTPKGDRGGKPTA